MRGLLKSLLNTLALVAVSPLWLSFLVLRVLFGSGRVFPGFSQLVSLLPGVSGQYLRRAFYRLVLPRLGQDACICFGATLSHTTAEIGQSVYVGVGCLLGDVSLEDDVLLGSHVSIINGSRQHGTGRLDIPVREQPGEYPRVTVGRDAWIGDRSVVMADIGAHAVVGAGSVVTKPVDEYAIVAGNPARVIGSRLQAQSKGGIAQEPLPTFSEARVTR